MSLAELNVSLFRLINDWGKENPVSSSFFVFLTSYSLYLLVAVVLMFLLVPKWRDRLMVGCAVATVLLAELIRVPVSLLHSNLQPFAELSNVNQLVDKAVGNSFPSDHTIVVVSLCVTFALFQKRLAPLWIVFAALVAVSRIWVGVHYPADVIVGALIATASALFVFRTAPKLAFVQRPVKGPVKRF